MWPFRKEKELAKLKLVIDFRSASIGAALFLKSQEKKLKLIFCTRKSFVLPKDTSTDDFLKKSERTLDIVLASIENEGIKKNSIEQSDNFIDDVLCAFSSPWYESKIVNYEIKEKEPVKFNKKLIENIFNNEFNGKAPGDLSKELEKKITSVYMNGYEISSPNNKEAKEISLALYKSHVSEKITDFVNKKVAERFGVSNIKFCTHPIVLLSALKKLFHSISDFVAVDVGGETTDILLFKAGKITDLISVPIGSNIFIRKIMDEKSLEYATAISHLNLLLEEKLDKTNSGSDYKMLEMVKAAFVKKIFESVKDKWTKEIVPSTIFLISDLENLNLLKSILMQKDLYNKALKINKEPIIHPINREIYNDHLSFEKDTFVDNILSLIGVHIEEEKN